MLVVFGSKRWTQVTLAMVASVTAMALLAPASQALLAGELKVHPSKAELSAGCAVADLEVLQCNHSVVLAGSVVIGRQTVPISVPGDTLDISNGYNYETANFEAIMGTKPPLNGPGQPVPGGLLGLAGLSGATTAVTATFEYAGAVTPFARFGLPGESAFQFNYLSTGEHPGLVLPVKIHLQNPILGKTCYIGSNAKPFVIRMTTGTTSPPPPAKPLKGSSGVVESQESAQVIRVTRSRLVDNSFSVPGAQGCGELLDQAIDMKLGLPSPPGRNALIFEGSLWSSAAEYDRS